MSYTTTTNYNNITLPAGYTLPTGGTVTLSGPIGTGIAGSVLTSGYTTSGATVSSANWSNPNTSFTSSNYKSIMTIPHGEEKMVLEKDATLEVKGNVVINGIDLEERLNTIEKVLQIPNRDVTMETKHPKLAELFKQYMHELEKYRTWDRVKGEEDGTT